MIPAGRWLDCGCCGMGFQTWEGYIDQDQDRDYGICKLCQGDAEGRVADHENEVIKLVSDNLTGENKEKFDSSERFRQLYFCHRLQEKGVLKWTIGGFTHE